MTVQHFTQKKIYSNPWQTRLTEDPEHIKGLADDIKAKGKANPDEGLMQHPVGRVHPDKPDCVQLAIGNSRTDAWFLAFPNRPLLVEVRELTDRQMSDYAASENAKRKNLSAIETAHALQRRIKDFDLTQEQAGEPFGLTQSAVNNLLRLLQLPEPVQAHVMTGQLPERLARGLIVLSRSLPKQSEQIALKVAKAEEKEKTFDHQVSEVLHDYGRPMWSPPWEDFKWTGPLDYVREKAVKLGFTDQLPACHDCPFFIQHENGKSCARPGCYDLKAEAWGWQQLAKSAKALGILVAQPVETYKVIFRGDEDEVALAKAALKSKHESLRLVRNTQISNYDYPNETRRYNVLGNKLAALATVDFTALKKVLPAKQAEATKPKTQAEKEKAAEVSFTARQRAQAEKEKQRKEARKAEKLLIATAAQCMSPLLPDQPALLGLLMVSDGGWQAEEEFKAAKTLRNKKVAVMKVLIENHLYSREDYPFGNNPAGTAKLAEVLYQLAQSLKVKLPKDFGPAAPAAKGHKSAAPHVRGNKNGKGGVKK